MLRKALSAKLEPTEQSGFLAIEVIGAMTVPENESSTRLLARLGFALEGTLRRVLFFDGCWHDVALYGTLRDESVASGPRG